jgi:hypothetical protein
MSSGGYVSAPDADEAILPKGLDLPTPDFDSTMITNSPSDGARTAL